MPNKKRLFKIAMIVVSAFLGFTTMCFAAYYVYEHKEELPIIRDYFPTPSYDGPPVLEEVEEDEDATETGEPVDPDDLEWEEYYNVDMNFRIKYPRSWYFHTKYLAPPPPATTYIANISPDDYETDTEHAGLNVLALERDETLEANTEIELLVEDGYTKTAIKICGLPAYRLERRSHPLDTGATVYVVYKELTYRIGWMGTTVEIFEQYEEVLEEMFSSFHFVDEKGYALKECGLGNDNTVDEASNDTGDEGGEFWSGDIYLGPVEPGNTALMQANADQGIDLWRLNPVEVAHHDGPDFGFSEGDEYSLIQEYRSDTYDKMVAEVEAVHMTTGDSYTISLRQDETQGSTGIWVVYWVSETE